MTDLIAIGQAALISILRLWYVIPLSLILIPELLKIEREVENGKK